MGYNPYIVIPFATWAITQVAKFAIAALKGRLDFRYLYASGGMPSVHSAVVCSLATTALLVSGANSPIFGLTAIFAAIVMYDSFGVRRSAGEQAAAINMLIGSLDRGKVRLEQPQLHLREILGHQPQEVAVGAVVGVALAGLFNYDRLAPVTNFITVTPMAPELWVYAGIFGAAVVLGIAQRLILNRRYRQSPALRRVGRRITTASQTIGWAGLAAVALQYERASYLSWRLWADLLLVAGVIWATALIARYSRSVPEQLAAEAAAERKAKWFRFGRNKRKAKRA